MVNREYIHQAETWLDTVSAEGGTELLKALQYLFKLEITPQCQNLKVLLFGIDTAVNQDLFESILKKAPGMFEYIYPGESMEEKVSLQFERINFPAVRKILIKGKESEIFPKDNVLIGLNDVKSIFVITDQDGENDEAFSIEL